LAIVQPREQRWQALLERMATGDQTALAVFYDATSTTVHALVGRIVKDAAVAEEVTGDVYLQAWSHAARFDAERGSPLTWLMAIARTRAIDRVRVGVAWRAAQAPLEAGLQVPCGRLGPEDAYSTRERRAHVQAALADLPAEQRTALELAYYEGLSHTEIAERLDQPLGTVKTRIRLAMNKLRDALASIEGRLQ
jgi:RNA polymerase sigma-70 factor (ECF subfamily)